MAGIASAGLARRAGGNLGQASPDVLRAMVQAFAGALAGAGADTLCGAPYGQVSEDRVDYRNECRQRRRDTRAGTTGLAGPGLVFPGAAARAAPPGRAGADQRGRRLLPARGRHPAGGDPRDHFAVQEPGRRAGQDAGRGGGAVPVPAGDAGPYRFVQAGALTVRARGGGRTVIVHALIATGVNAGGTREIPGSGVPSAGDGAGRLASFRGPAARGLSGAAPATSGARPGPAAAIAPALPGATWRRRRTRYLRDLPATVNKASQPRAAALARTISGQPGPAGARAQPGRAGSQAARGS